MILIVGIEEQQVVLDLHSQLLQVLQVLLDVLWVTPTMVDHAIQDVVALLQEHLNEVAAAWSSSPLNPLGVLHPQVESQGFVVSTPPKNCLQLIEFVEQLALLLPRRLLIHPLSKGFHFN